MRDDAGTDQHLTRLAPEHVYPSAIEDAASAFDYLVSSEGVAKLGIDTSRIAFFGQSAGSCLATGLSIALKKKASKVMPKIVALDRCVYEAISRDLRLTSCEALSSTTDFSILASKTTSISHLTS